MVDVVQRRLAVAAGGKAQAKAEQRCGNERLAAGAVALGLAEAM